MGTPNKVPLIVGNPHIPLRSVRASSVEICMRLKAVGSSFSGQNFESLELRYEPDKGLRA